MCVPQEKNISLSNICPWDMGGRQERQEDTNNAFLTRRLRDLGRAVQLSNQSREEKLIKVSLLSPPLCQVRLSANPKRLLQREVQSLNIILVLVSVWLTILLDKLQHNYTSSALLYKIGFVTCM